MYNLFTNYLKTIYIKEKDKVYYPFNSLCTSMILESNPGNTGNMIIIIIIIIILIIRVITITIIKHGWNKNNHASIQHINFYELSEVTASIIKYTLILILNSRND